MLAEMKDLARTHNLCVLATSDAGGRPHCSLMAYVVNADCTELYMATFRSTRKFRNLSSNPAVSLMIDTRHEVPRPQIQAMTIEGICSPVTNRGPQEQIRTLLLTTHPHLEELLNHEDCAIVCVEIRSFLLLKGPKDSYFAPVG